MKLLILGGTRFVGHHLAAAALARRHELTLFHRGIERTAPDPAVETILGDRNHDLDRLHGRWDAVIDTCGYLPRSVRQSAEFLGPSVERYVFISSISAYADPSAPGLDETAPLADLSAEQLRQANEIDPSGPVSAATYGRMYGGLKALCEAAAEEVLPNRVLTIRPGLVVGPRDYTDRFTYWPVRVARGGEVLAPGSPGRYVQFIDARDLAEWIIDMVERRQTGIYNASGAPHELTMGALLETCRAVSGSDARFTWVSESFLAREHVTPWSEMPLWLPEQRPGSSGSSGRSSSPRVIPSEAKDPPALAESTRRRACRRGSFVAPLLRMTLRVESTRGTGTLSIRKAAAAGLRHRPLHETVADVLRWYREHEHGRALRAGLAAAREEALLKTWVDDFGNR
ncbi:MAG TPA: NAD-dependent epimerase/dehydratase family protein [Thermoanaerobaculia bacterium]